MTRVCVYVCVSSYLCQAKRAVSTTSHTGAAALLISKRTTEKGTEQERARILLPLSCMLLQRRSKAIRVRARVCANGVNQRGRTMTSAAESSKIRDGDREF